MNGLKTTVCNIRPVSQGVDGAVVHVPRAGGSDPGDGQERGVHARGLRRRARARRPPPPPASAA